MRPSNAALNRSETNGVNDKRDAAEQQTTQERDEVVDADPRMVFEEMEFKNVREKYKMPNHVSSPVNLNLMNRLSYCIMDY